MNQSFFIGAKKLFSGSFVVRNFSFKANRLGDSHARLAVVSPFLGSLDGLLRGESAHFQLRDCFECLSPRMSEV